MVYRLIFYNCETQIIEKFREVFKNTFGLSEAHYQLEQQPEAGCSVFWRIYWDRKGLELDLLKKCESELDKVAENTNIKVAIVEMAIIPRSLEFIRGIVDTNK